MERCLKCSGTNFVKEGVSELNKEVKYVLCSCGNVMIKREGIDVLIPTPEVEGDLTTKLIEDAKKALNVGATSVYLTAEDHENAINNALENYIQQFATSEDEEDEDCEVCQYCGEPCNDCYCDEEEYDDEDEEEECCCSGCNNKSIIEKCDAMVKERNEEMLTSIWSTSKATLTQEALEDFAAKMLSSKERVDSALAMTKKHIESITNMDMGSTIARTIGEAIEKAIEETREAEKEDTDSYLILSKEGPWMIISDVTTEELEDILNNEITYKQFAISKYVPVDLEEQHIIQLRVK